VTADRILINRERGIPAGFLKREVALPGTSGAIICLRKIA
jgi:hypothetical protein